MCASCAQDVVPAAPGHPASFVHEGPIRDALHALKYRRELALVGPLANVLARHPKWQDESVDAWVAVPLHRLRQLRRGFNQVSVLLHAVRSRLPEHARRRTWSPMIRTRRTGSQVGRDRAARHRHMRDAFALRPRWSARVAGRHILLVDDVVTSGATLAACRDVLQEAGARVSVLALMVAVA